MTKRTTTRAVAVMAAALMTITAAVPAMAAPPATGPVAVPAIMAADSPQCLAVAAYREWRTAQNDVAAAYDRLRSEPATWRTPAGRNGGLKDAPAISWKPRTMTARRCRRPGSVGTVAAMGRTLRGELRTQNAGMDRFRIRRQMGQGPPGGAAPPNAPATGPIWLPPPPLWPVAI